MKNSALIVLSVLLSSLGASPVTAEQFYKWTDANGVVQYTSTPPPANSAATERVTVSASPTPAAPPAAPTPASTAADGTPAQSADVSAENERRQQEYKQKMCAYSRQQLAETQQRRPGRVVETRGTERKVVLPAERTAESSKWQGEIGKFCG